MAPRHASELNEAFENSLTAGPALAKMMFVDETCKLWPSLRFAKIL